MPLGRPARHRYALASRDMDRIWTGMVTALGVSRIEADEVALAR